MTKNNELLSTINATRGVIARLASADTPRKLTNARKAFLKWHRLIRKLVDEEYPPLSGKMHRSGAFCPICRLPMSSYKRLVAHLEVRHKWSSFRCPCGFIKPGGAVEARKALVRHLSHMPNTSEHIVHWEMVRRVGYDPTQAKQP